MPKESNHKNDTPHYHLWTGRINPDSGRVDRLFRKGKAYRHRSTATRHAESISAAVDDWIVRECRDGADCPYNRRPEWIGKQLPKGNPRALTAAQVKELRRRWNSGETGRTLVGDFPLSRGPLERAARGETYKDIPMPTEEA